MIYNLNLNLCESDIDIDLKIVTWYGHLRGISSIGG